MGLQKKLTTLVANAKATPKSKTNAICYKGVTLMLSMSEIPYKENGQVELLQIWVAIAQYKHEATKHQVAVNLITKALGCVGVGLVSWKQKTRPGVLVASRELSQTERQLV